jgi:hypothetical protein
MGERVTIEQLGDDLRARNLAEAKRREADPEYQARERDRLARQAAQVEREIAEGKRDADGQWVTTPCARCAEPMDAANVEAFEETGELVCDSCADDVFAEMENDE